MTSENNRRIAKNTVLLYIRTLFSQLLALYTSRKILEILGVEDYGINNVVGGVVGMLTFLNGSMAVATQRYLTIELGRNDMKAYNKIFSMACIIHVVLALLICVAAETVGLWFVNHQLNIPSERMVAANWIYQISVMATFIGIVQVPYMASITAHENLDVYAYVGMSEAVLRLVAVFLLLIISFDKLVSFGLLMLGIQVLSASVYRVFSVRRFRECHFRWQWDTDLFRSLLGFTGWNMFGTVAWILKDQGINVVMNLFGGPLVNAARGVAYQVSNAVQNLVNNFSAAVGPQLTKNYASGNRQGLHRLLMVSSKVTYFLLFLVALPVMIEIPYLLQLWLIQVPEHTVLFTRLILLEALVATFGSPMITSLMATGNIKLYQIVVGSIMLLNVPLSYWALYIGLPIAIPFVVSIGITVIAFALRLWFCKYQIGLSVKEYLRVVLLPVVVVSVFASVLPLWVNMKLSTGFFRLFLVVIISTISVFSCLYIFGLNKVERSVIIAGVVTQLKKFKK